MPQQTLRERISSPRASAKGVPTESEKNSSEAHVEKYQHLQSKRFQDLAKSYGAVGSDGKYQGFWSDPFCLRDFKISVLSCSLPRLLFAVAFFFLGLYMNSLSQAWLQRNMSGYYEKMCPGPHKTLWDITFKVLPYVPTTRPADLFASAAPAYLVLRFIVFPGPLSLRWTILCRWLTVWGTIWMVRSLTIVVTPLPNPDHTCKPIISFPDNLFAEAFMIAITKDLTCQDVMFSGHTVALTLSTLFISKYTSVAPWSSIGASRAWISVSTFVNVFGSLFVVTGYYFIAASHFHYTLDVLVGALVTYTMFRAYHNRLELAWLRKVHGGNGIMDPFLHWYERDSRDLLKYSTKAALSEEKWLDEH